MATPVRILSVPRLDPAQVEAVRKLLERSTATDGAVAVNESGLLHLDHPAEDVQHLLALPPAGMPGTLRGYAQLDATGPTSTGQLVVDPAQRRHQVGRALLHRLVELAPTPVQVWAVGDAEAARALAATEGLVPARELLVMTRSLLTELRTPELPDGVTVRAFVRGRDEQAWLEVNARAFASHPEQGGVTLEDLRERMAEPWFDPAGFLLAERGGRLVGSHWTKRHSATLGEVYVLGVDPEAGGRGLGGALLDLGLQHLRDTGLSEVELYVEGDHERAVALYQGRGFTTASRDVMYARP
ncbi:mycothiol synthase [uncultured Friedmanniella sp.]|uniref:mycothiol synthase n=1 Tax=uncultured Friedmanniella sp. TaxID=335381 RepID=UPI0035CB052E